MRQSWRGWGSALILLGMRFSPAGAEPVPTKNLIPMAKVKNRGMIRPNDRDLDTAPIHPRLAL